MKYILSVIFFIISYVSYSQTYNPAQGTVSNKPYAPGQAVPTDSRSYFYDATNFLWRPYQSTTEVLSYLNLAKYRTGQFSIIVNPTGTLNGNGTFTGGTIAEYWFKNGTANGNLVLKTDSTKANQSALVDTSSAIRSILSARVNPIAGTNMTITGTYPNLTFNASGGGGAVSITGNANTGVYVTPSPITGSGSVSNDTTKVATRLRLQKVIDSLDYYQDTLFVSNTFTSGVPLTFTNIDYDSIFVKRLIAGAGINLTQNNDSSITASLDSATAATYASNTASNLGASGSSWYKQKVGVDLQFRKVIGGTNVTVTENTNDITISATTGGESNTASNVGASGEGVFKQKTGVNLEFKKIIAGSNITVTPGTDDITIAASAPVGESNTASNLGASGSSWFKQKTGVDLEFRKVIAGANISVTQNADDITIASSAGGGESNTASNVGAGSGWWKQKTGVDLEFKSVIATTGISATANTDDVTLKADTSTLSTVLQMQKRLNDTALAIRSMAVGEVNTGSNLGATGGRVFSSKVGVDFQFRRIIAGTNVTVNENTNDLTISASTGGETNTASNVGSGNGVYKQKTGVNLELKTLVAGSGVTITNNTNDLTLSASSYESKDTITPATNYHFCYVKSVSPTFEISNKSLKIGSIVNDDKRTITINAMLYVLSSDWTGGGNNWVEVATVKTGFRPSGIISFPISQSVILNANAATSPVRADDGTTGITSANSGTNTGVSVAYIDPDTGKIFVKIVSVTDYGVLSGNDVLVIPIVVTYFTNINT